jgi:hypothetical protein
MVRILLLVALLSTLFVQNVEAQSTTYPQPTGLAIISGDTGDWHDQLYTLDTMDATFVRLPITQGFGNWPGMVDDLIAIGITHISLQTRDCNVEYHNIYRDLIDQAFQLRVHHNPATQFYLEIGNEPDICGRDPTSYRTTALDTLNRIKPLVSYPNLQFVLGLGVHPDYNQELLRDGSVLANFDGLAYHIYAHGNLGDIPDIYSYYRDELAPLDVPILLTEVGINGDIGETAKAQRYREFALNPPGDPAGIAFWTVASDWKPQYHITPYMAQIMSGKECFAETGYCISGAFQQFWHANGLEYGDPGVSFRESLHLWGYPMSDVFTSDTGYQTQVFERMMFEYHPELPPLYRVMLRRLAAEQCDELCPR